MSRTGTPAFVHERALCESDSVGAGTRIWPFAQVMAGARIGADCNICGGAFVEAGARIGDRVTVKNNVLLWDGVEVEDDVFLGPSAVFTNDLDPRAAYKKERSGFLPTHVARGATIGANATIVCGVRVGEFSFVAAGAVVVSDIERHALVAGNPARRIAWVCACGGRLDGGLSCPRCGTRHIEQRGGVFAVDRGA